MKIKKSSAVVHKLSLMTFAVLASTSALADDPLGWYVGGNVGPTSAGFNQPSAATAAALTGPGFIVNSYSERKRDKFGYKLYGGYQLNRNFAIEGGYFDLGDSRYTFNTTPGGSLSGETSVKGVNLDLVGILPITDKFSVLGRVGAAHARSRTHFSNAGAVPFNGSRPSSSDTNVKYGVGMQYAFTDQLAVRGEYERYRITDPIRNKGHIDQVSVGLVYHFGEKARPVQTQYVPPPVVAAPAPAPAPVYVAPPPPPAPAPVVIAPPPPPAPAPYTPPVRPTKQGRN